MEKVWRSPIAQHRIRLNRGDIGFGQEAIMAWHEQGNGKRPSYLFKLKLNGWSCERRVIVERNLKPLNASPQGSFWRQCKEDFSAYVANLTTEETDPFQIIQLYRQRGDGVIRIQRSIRYRSAPDSGCPHSTFCTCSRIFSSSVFASTMVWAMPASLALEPMVLNSRKSSWQRKSRARPGGSAASRYSRNLAK